MCVVLQFARNGDTIVAVRRKTQVSAQEHDPAVSEDVERNCAKKLAIDTSSNIVGLLTAAQFATVSQKRRKGNVVRGGNATIPTPLELNRTSLIIYTLSNFLSCFYGSLFPHNIYKLP